MGFGRELAWWIWVMYGFDMGMGMTYEKRKKGKKERFKWMGLCSNEPHNEAGADENKEHGDVLLEKPWNWRFWNFDVKF